MAENAWRDGKPPNETIVEVEWEGEIVRVQAYYGRNGRLPHWESEDGDTMWITSAFNRWRPVAGSSPR
jgi:hypothetical protein